MRLALLLPLLIACNLEQQTCMDVPAWVLSDVGIEVDNMTRVAVVGRAEPIWGDENPAAVVVVYDGYDLETNSWTTVLASAVLDPDGEQEFVVTSDEIRYWSGSDGYNEVCASVFAPGSNYDAPSDLGCIGD